MSDNLERVLLINMPVFVNEWVLKSTTPCGDLIDRIEKNPSDPSTMVIFTKGRANALMIARTLDNYNLCGSVIQAWCAFMKPPEASKAEANGSIVDGIQAGMGKSDENSLGRHSSKNPKGPKTAHIDPARAEDETGKLQQDSKRRSSVNIDSTEALELVRRAESEERPSKTSSRRSSRRKDSRSRDSLPRSEQAEDASPKKSQRCRFCYRLGHVTWLCKKRAEYYKVDWTTKGSQQKGYQWPESCIVKVEELYAGPIIEYIERHHLQMEEMNREQIRIMFAWLTNPNVCYQCGAAGHQEADRLCKYLPLSRPVTDKEIAQFRKPFCMRMKGIRKAVSFGELQLFARSANQQFRRQMQTQDPRPLQPSDKSEEEHSEKPPIDTSAEPTDKNEEHSPPVESDSILFPPVGEGIKIERPEDGYEQITDDEDDVVFVRQVAPRKRTRLVAI